VQVVNLSAARFFRDLLRPDPADAAAAGWHGYYSRPVAKARAPALKDDLVDDAPAGSGGLLGFGAAAAAPAPPGAPPPPALRMSVWLGSANTTAQLHFDFAPNLFVQVA
jgi:hypothetical protein